MTRLRRTFDWLADLGRWLWLPVPVRFYLLLTPLIISAFAIVSLGSTEPAIRLTGLVLQLLGIGTVIWGIQETRRLFNRPTLSSVLAGWVKQRPRFHGKSMVASPSGGTLGLLGGQGRGYQTRNPPPNASTEQRLDSLEANVDLVHRRISGVFSELDEMQRKQSDAVRGEQRAREQADEQLKKKLEAHGTGGFHISAIGAVWLFVGVVLSTASPQLAVWLQ